MACFKNILIVPIFIILGILILGTSSIAATYVVTQLSNNDLYDRNPEINDSGQIVWAQRGPPNNRDNEIMLNANGTTTILTNNASSDWNPRINNQGHVAWYNVTNQGGSSHYEVFLYDGSTVSSKENPGAFPDINDNDEIAFAVRTPFYPDIYLDKNSGPVTQLSVTPGIRDRYPLINNSAQVVWIGSDPHTDLDDEDDSREIYFHNGSATLQLTNNDYEDKHHRINNNGHIVWRGRTRPRATVFYYDGTTTVGVGQGTDPDINDYNEIVWSGYVSDAPKNQIFLRDGSGIITQITDNTLYNGASRINNNGHIAFLGGIIAANQKMNVFVQNGSAITQLTSYSAGDNQTASEVRISNNNCVAWVSLTYYITESEVFRACPRTRFVPIDLGKFRWQFEWLGRLPFPFPLPEPWPSDPPGPVCRSSWCPPPEYLQNLYRSAASLRDASRGQKISKLEGKRMLKALKKAPAGERFTKSLKTSAMKMVRKYVGAKKRSAKLEEKLLKAINAVELDWRMPAMRAQKVKAGKDRFVDFDGVAQVAFKDVKKPGKITLKIRSGVPALVKGHEPGWPVVSYQANFAGRLKEHADISINYGSLRFNGDVSTLRLLQWDGRTYKDITTVVDLPAKVIRGRTDKLSTFVVMRAALDDKRELRRGKMTSMK